MSLLHLPAAMGALGLILSSFPSCVFSEGGFLLVNANCSVQDPRGPEGEAAAAVSQGGGNLPGKVVKGICQVK